MRFLVFWMFVSLSFLISMTAYADNIIEISGSPFATDDALVPARIKSTGEKMVLVDPRQHAWGAYDAKGKLMRWGIATTGSNWCSDTKRECRTKTGSFRIYSLGDASCVSSKFPVPVGGASMPYCMYFSGGQALHGSNDVEFGNESHGCVRMHVGDAEWLRYKFVEGPRASNQYRGTLVVVKAY